MSEFCCALSSIVTYANVPTVSAHKTNEQFQATSQGQFCLLSCSDVTKAMAYPCVCNPALREARNWAACVHASDALTATSRLYSSNRTCCVAHDVLVKTSWAAIKRDTFSSKYEVY